MKRGSLGGALRAQALVSLSAARQEHRASQNTMDHLEPAIEVIVSIAKGLISKTTTIAPSVEDAVLARAHVEGENVVSEALSGFVGERSHGVDWGVR